MKTDGHRRRSPRLLLAAGPVAVFAVFTVFSLLVGTAWAGWNVNTTGTGRIASQSIPQGQTPTATASGADVTVSWAQTSMSGGTPAAGYVLARYTATGTTAQTLTSCTGVIAGLTCTETLVPKGTWRYTIRPVVGSWTGAQSPYSATVNVSGPRLATLEMFDVNANGKVDRVVATFDAKIHQTYTAGTTPWTLSNVPSGGTLASVSVTGDSAVTLNLTEGAGALDTAVGSFTVALAADAGGVRGLDNSPSSFSATAPADKTAPVRTSMVANDDNGDAFIDNVTVAFSEVITTPGNDKSWTLSNVPSGSAFSTSTATGNTANLTLANPTTAANTALGSFTVELGTTGPGVTDAAANKATFAAAAPTDGARPVPLTLATTTAGSTAGRIQPGDRLAVTLSEPLGAGVTLPASVTLAMSSGAVGTNNTLTVPSMFDGARSTGSAAYVTSANASASFASSTLALSADRKTITVTVGPSCSGLGCTVLGTATAAPFSALLAPALLDAAGNAPITTARNISVRLF